MALLAGLTLTARWHDWAGTPASESSTDPISVYTHHSSGRGRHDDDLAVVTRRYRSSPPAGRAART